MGLFDWICGKPPVRDKSALGHGKAMPCLIRIGGRGSGKSQDSMNDMRTWARERKACLVHFDCHGQTVRDELGWMLLDGHAKRTWIEVASETDKSLQTPFLVPSTDPSPLKRKEQNKLRVEQAFSPIWNVRGVKDGSGNPLIKLFGEGAGHVAISLPEVPPPNVMYKLFEPNSPEYAYMLDTATDKDAVKVFRGVEALYERSPSQYRYETGGPMRALKILESPAIWIRHGNSFDWKKAIKEKWIVLYDLSGVSSEVARYLTITTYMNVITACKELFLETGKSHPTHIELEEAGAQNTVTPGWVGALQEWRKAGFSGGVNTQTNEDFDDQELFEQLLGLCDIHKWFRMNTGAARAARDLSDPTFDPLAVHYTRDRMVQSGTIKTTSVRKSHDGKNLGHTDSERAGYSSVTDEFYKSPQLQLQEWETAVSNLQTGECFVRTKQGVQKVSCKLVGTAWPSFIAKTRTEKLIAEIRSRPEYRPPTAWIIPRGGAAGRFGGS